MILTTTSKYRPLCTKLRLRWQIQICKCGRDLCPHTNQDMQQLSHLHNTFLHSSTSPCQSDHLVRCALTSAREWTICNVIILLFFKGLSLCVFYPLNPSISSLSHHLFYFSICHAARLMQLALCWCLQAEALRGWNNVKLTTGSVVWNGPGQGTTCRPRRGGSPLHFTSWLLPANSSWAQAASFSNKIISTTQRWHEGIKWDNDNKHSPALYAVIICYISTLLLLNFSM